MHETTCCAELASEREKSLKIFISRLANFFLVVLLSLLADFFAVFFLLSERVAIVFDLYFD